ncbi:MAG: polysaccharide deacetylase family protein [Rhodocyclaceae bacterium]|nr:polysaccharide deacetylase family protein [Rhodocyclaceae bacterium]
MNPPRPWRPTPLLILTGLVHLGVVVAWLARPASWPAWLLLLAANHAVLSAAGLWPRSRLLGPNILRLPEAAIQRREVAITIDDGPDPELTPQVLDILEAHRARASFFCIGARAEAHPALIAEIVRRGHDIENHSQRHRHSFSLMGPGGFRREIAAAQASLGRLAGDAPRFFRAPAGLRNPFLEPQLAAQGLQLAAWTRRGFDTRERDPERILARLLDGLAAGDILLVHDGHGALDARGRPVILSVLPRLLEAIAAAGLRPVSLRQGFR